jgi:hypothetical protein
MFEHAGVEFLRKQVALLGSLYNLKDVNQELKLRVLQ